MAFEINGTEIIDDNGSLTVTPTKLVARQLLRFSDSTQAQGDISGYTSGGSITNIIDKFPFATDVNASDVGNLTAVTREAAGQSSLTNGYTSGGETTPVADLVNIQKFPFATDTNASNIGDLTGARHAVTGQSSAESGYSSGGFAPAVVTIDKFPFSTDENATGIGDLTTERSFSSGQSSSTSGYTSGGYKSAVPSPLALSSVDKFPFATDTNAAFVASLTQARQRSIGHSSAVSGYASGGRLINSSVVDTVDKFPFAVDGSASDVGDLSQTAEFLSGQSAAINSSAYTTGGVVGAGLPIDTITRFHFSSDAKISNVGVITEARSAATGQQV